MVLRWNENTAFTGGKIKDNLKECLDISGGTWLSGDVAQAPVAFEFGKNEVGAYSVFTTIFRDWQMAMAKGERGQNAK